MKRIAFIDLMFMWPPSGGATTDLKEVITRFSECGYEVKLFVPDFPDYLPRGVIDESLPFPVEKINFNKYSFNKYTLPSRFRRAVEGFSPDIVFIGDGYNMKPMLLSAFEDYKTIVRFYAYEVFCYTFNLINNRGENCTNNLFLNIEQCKDCKYPGGSFFKALAGVYLNYNVNDLFYLLNTQEIFSSGAYSGSYQKTAKKLLGGASEIIVYNPFTKDLLNGISSNVNVFPSGVDTLRFMPGNKKKGEKTAILMTGRISYPPKGFKIIEAACRKLLETRDDFMLFCTADVDMTMDAIPKPFCDHIVFLNWMNQEKLPMLYEMADICVVPSTWHEPFGITAVEAMACGKPVIASSVGGLSGIVENGKTGFLVKPNDVEGVCNALKQLLDDRGLMINMGNEGRKRATEFYDWDIVMKKYYFPLIEAL
ncbi:MAG: glycosyltransferase family 4 protein [Candidatus Schekmanbacteria bacterium]|nr:glycosyltransferase family 4 protein [Candidatus Schekmanbacteria bacterium]